MAVFLVAFILCGAVSAANVKSSQLSTSKINVGTLPAQQSNADIYGTRVVWQEHTPYIPFTSIKSSVWIKNLATGYKGKVMASSQNQLNPKISGSNVVWEQIDSSGHSSIYYKNVVTGKTGKVLLSTNNQYNPDISGGLVVWKEMDGKVANIHYKNIFTGENGSVSPSTNNQISPAVSGTRVVWMQQMPLTGPPKYLTFKWVLYVKNIKTGNNELVLSSTHSQWHPAISGHRIAWIQAVAGISGYVLYYKNIVTGSYHRIQSLSQSSKSAPAIDGGLIAWTNEFFTPRIPSHDFIYYINIETNEHGRVYFSMHDQYSPAVSGSRIVWTQDRLYTNKENFISNSIIYIKNLKTGLIGRLTP